MLASPKGWEVERRGIEVAGAPARWRDPLALALLAALSWALWVRVTGDDLAAMLGGEAPSEVAGFARWAALLGRIGGEVVEAGFYALAWRAFGRPVRFSPLFLGIAGLSTLDAIGNILVRAGGGD